MNQQGNRLAFRHSLCISSMFIFKSVFFLKQSRSQIIETALSVAISSTVLYSSGIVAQLGSRIRNNRDIGLIFYLCVPFFLVFSILSFHAFFHAWGFLSQIFFLFSLMGLSFLVFFHLLSSVLRAVLERFDALYALLFPSFLSCYFFLGIFEPALRASERPIAIACLGLLTTGPPLEPLWSLPSLYSSITFLTFLCSFPFIDHPCKTDLHSNFFTLKSL